MVVFQECLSATGWQEIEVLSSDKTKAPYVVTIPPWDRGELTEVTCSCPSFLHRGWCRHQGAALKALCRWSELESSLEQSQEQRVKRICPECGGRTHIVVEEES